MRVNPVARPEPGRCPRHLILLGPADAPRDWLQFGYDAAHSGYIPSETTLDARERRTADTAYQMHDARRTSNSAPGVRHARSRRRAAPRICCS